MRLTLSRTLAILVVLLSACCTLTPQAPRPHFTAQATPADPPTVDVGTFDESLPKVLEQFASAAANAKTVTLRIDSPGGNIFDGLRFIRDLEDIKKLRGVHTRCVVDGNAFSMAAVFLESPACDERLATSRSAFLFHNGSTGARGTTEELAAAQRLLEVLNKTMAAMVSERLGVSVAEYRRHITHGDWVMAADEALANHVIDGLVASSSINPPSEE